MKFLYYILFFLFGNVDTLLQDINQGTMKTTGNRFKKIIYDYDLISGKVNSVAYQKGSKDQFFHRYQYDAENRLTAAYTSPDGIYYERDATYQYYKHGPLARTVLGQLQVQGLDYAYTLQGWLKGVNSTSLQIAGDMGGDGVSANTAAKDVFGFSLNYYGNEYKPIGGKNPFSSVTTLGSAYKPLYNGNISAMVVNLPKVGDPILYNYRYDQLNRLVAQDAYTGLNTATNEWKPIAMDDYKERLSYDANGNIKSYLRNGSGITKALNNYTYTYQAGTNKLTNISNSVTAESKNYTYDEIGNTITDEKQSVSKGVWNVYGKLQSVQTPAGTVSYTYNVGGQRLSKKIGGAEEYYVRDAEGNTMAVYNKDPALYSGKLILSEQHIYGSSLLGMRKPDIGMESGDIDTNAYRKIRGAINYLLSDHRSSNYAVLLDKRTPIESTTATGTVDHYEAVVLSATDYSSFGTTTRSYNADKMRLGFDGQLKSPEISPTHQTAEFWEYNSDVGRRWNIDVKPSVAMSPYAVFANNPIFNSDPLGDTARVAKNGNGTPTGELGQRFKFGHDASITDAQSATMETNFLSNLQQQVNGRTGPSGATVSLNTNDPLASVINVTFGASGVSNASMQNNSIFISLQDMPNANNTATHEWLHTAGLMDRYYEIFGYNNNNGRGITIDQQRMDVLPMKNLPLGYDPQYDPSKNIMSAAGSQITNQQWDIVFSGVNERSLGGLGVVSLLVSNSHITQNSKYYRSILNSTSKMAFSANQAFSIGNAGGVLLQNPYVSGANPAPSHYVIHGMNGAPNTYNSSAPFLANPNNQASVNNFRR